ncbi:MAG: ATP-binding protein [Candidatus Firestonebacteria bacterium]|nr:ATP-binding protein [Candidatus Firestonebacteria bacterium]
MITRRIQTAVERSLREFPVVGLVGSRQTGKTTLARSIAQAGRKPSVFLDLERPSDLAKLQDPELYLEPLADRLVILDEVQHKKDLFPVLRALVDSHRKNGRFLVLGSAASELLRQSAESLAGRIRYHELGPLTLDETAVPYADFRRSWVRGGYPLSFLARTEVLSLAWREAFLKTYSERDLFQLGIRVPTPQIRRFLQMVAHSHGQIWNHSKIAASLGVSAPTAHHYLDILTETFILRQLQPYAANSKKRLVKSPKIYFRDCGILHALLQINNFDDLQGHPALGASWEGFVVEQILSCLPDGWQAYFYRTQAGAELDLFLMGVKRQRIAIEIKYNLRPVLTRGFREAFTDLHCTAGYIIYPGRESYSLAEHIKTLSIIKLADLF